MKLTVGKGRERGSITARELGTILAIVIAIIGMVVQFVGKSVDIGSIFTFLGGVSVIIFHNVGFWIMLVVACGYGLVRKLTNPEEFLWRELPIQLGASFVAILVLYSIFFSTATDLADKEIWNGYVTAAEYYEEWTEEVTTEDKDGNKSTSYVTHPPQWKVLTTAGNFSSDSGTYANYRRHFGNESKENLYHANQSSFGDGDKFYVECDRNPGASMPASRAHLFVNYLKASDSIRKLRGNIDAHRPNLREYPKVYAGEYGEIELDRVVEAGISLPPQWRQAVDMHLDRELRSLGAQKEVNILVYVTGSPDRSFAEALKEYWVQGKKNDVIVIIGAPRFPEVSWTEVIAWTKVEEFKIVLRDKIAAMKTLPDGNVLAASIVEEVAKPASHGGFLRTPSAELEYLAADVSLPWWCQFVIVLVGGAVCWVTSHILIHNDWRSWRQSFAPRFGRFAKI
jgi:hypothetical protein